MTDRRALVISSSGTPTEAVAGDAVAVPGLVNSAELRLSGAIAPSLSSDVDDWNPAGLSTTTFVNVTTTGGGGTRVVTGIALAAGQLVTLRNDLASDGNVYLPHEELGSSAGNRFALPNESYLDLFPGMCALLYKSAALGR